MGDMSVDDFSETGENYVDVHIPSAFGGEDEDTPAEPFFYFDYFNIYKRSYHCIIY